MEVIDPNIFRLTIFVLSIFVGYYVVWSVTPAITYALNGCNKCNILSNYSWWIVCLSFK